MTTSTSRLSFLDCFDAFNQALADTHGIRIRCATIEEAINLKMRMHTARAVDRKDNRMVYEEDPSHQLYGRSIYDRLACRIRQHEGDPDARWLYIEHIAIRGEIQALSGLPEWERVGQATQAQPMLPRITAPLLIEHVKRRV